MITDWEKDSINNTKADLWEAETSTFAAYAARKHVPLFTTFELTARCNLKCKMCYVQMSPKQIAESNKKELTTKQWIKLAEDAAEQGALYMLITGGEPLIREDFTEIYTELSHMGFLISLATNGSLIDEKYAKLLAKYPPTCTLVTLYGADSETYQSMCDNGAAFDKTIRGLEYLKDISTFLEVRTTFTKYNKDQLEQLREIGHRYTKRYAINYMVFGTLPGVCSPVSECRLSPVECYDIDENNRIYYQEKRKKAMEEAKAKGIKIGSEEKPLDVSFESNQKLDQEPKKEKDRGYGVPPTVLTCLSAKANCDITWDGRMVACGAFSSPYTLPLEEGFKKAWDRLPTLFEGITHPKKCQGCEYFNGCPNCLAYLQSETGSFDKAPEYICAIAKERRRRRILRESRGNE